MKLREVARAFCVFLMMIPAAPSVWAQEQTKNSVIEEVIVTARRTEEDIQTTPVAVTAVSALRMERMHPHDFADLNHIAPNFSIQGSSALFRNSAIAFARGIGYNNIDGTLDPALGIAIDGVPYLRNIGVLQNMFDLNNVEILLGPQGTLYGKNTIAGVMNITTQKPKLDEWEAKGRLRVGNLGRFDSELVGNAPIGDTVAVRVAFQSQYADGPYTNIHRDPGTNFKSGEDVGGDETKTVRASLYWEPNDRFDPPASASASRR
jgi:iron complex outermembrane receptor protein